MEIKETLILDAEEPLSKAINHLRKSPAVLITQYGEYFGMIDHRSLTNRVQDPSRTKCGSFAIRPPVLSEDSTWRERLNAFLVGHFKALPVINDNGEPLGITTRVETLKELKSAGMLPNISVGEIMNSPVYTIDEDKTIGDLKRLFKEKGAHRAVVLSGKKPVGVVCNYDVGLWLLKPGFSGGKMDFDYGATKLDIDNYLLRDVVRGDVTQLPVTSSFSDVIHKMIEDQHSFVLFVDAADSPVGVLSALDIFKIIRDQLAEHVELFISGLKGESEFEYEHIKSKIVSILDKFSKSLNIHYGTLHVKETKHTFQVNIHVISDVETIYLKGERATLKETVDELAEELERVLTKTKERKK